MSNWDEIRKEWKTSEITLAALAEKHGVKLGTLKSRKSREGWSRGSPEKDATKKKKVATPEPVINNDDLNDRQQLFCLYYLKYFNATKAYQKAYGCDYFTANANGSRLLVNASIKQVIERLKAEQQQGVYLDAQAVLQKYIDIAFADITDFIDFGQEKRPELDHNLEPMIDENGDELTYSLNYVYLKNHEEVDGTLITEVKKGKDGVSIKLADKMKALESLSKYTDLLSENELNKFKIEKLKAEKAKIEAETKNEEGGGSRVVIVNDKEAMRKALENGE